MQAGQRDLDRKFYPFFCFEWSGSVALDEKRGIREDLGDGSLK